MNKFDWLGSRGKLWTRKERWFFSFKSAWPNTYKIIVIINGANGFHFHLKQKIIENDKTIQFQVLIVDVHRNTTHFHAIHNKLYLAFYSPLIVQQVYKFFDVPFEVRYVQLATQTPTDRVQLMQVLNYHVQNTENKSWLVYYSRSDSLPVGIRQHLNNYVYWHKMIFQGVVVISHKCYMVLEWVGIVSN